MKGWHRDNYRHSLAARRISTAVPIKLTHRGKSKREALYEDILWLKGVLDNPERNVPSETLVGLQKELDDKEAAFIGMTSPRRMIKPSEMFTVKPWEERYKGTRGRRPEIISELPLYIDTLKSPQQKYSDYKSLLRELSDERAASKAMSRIDDELLSGKVDGLVTDFVVSKMQRGRGLSEPELLEEEEIIKAIERKEGLDIDVLKEEGIDNLLE